MVHWKFDEGSGTAALDSSGNGNAGTIVGAAYVPGRFGMALSFAGASRYLFASDAQSGDELFLNGLIDEVRVYDRALGAGEIAALAGLTDPPEPPVSWSAPVTLVSSHGRVAVGNRVHVVGHSGGNLVHRSSPDNGATWRATEVAMNTSEANLPHGIVADTNWVHIIAQPGAGTYARRPAPPPTPVFTSIRQDGAQVLLEWRGNGTLQWAGEVTGPWEDIPEATSPHPVTVERSSRFYRIVLR